MAKAEKGDLIRITDACAEEPYKDGDIFEVTSVYEVIGEYDSDVYVKYGDGGELLVCYDEYEVFRKAGEEDETEGCDMCSGDPERADCPYCATEEKAQDAVNSPNHYTQGRFEVIDIIEDAVDGAEPFEAVCQANILKYTLRYRHKNGIEDLKKARWYLSKLIEAKERDTIGEN